MHSSKIVRTRCFKLCSNKKRNCKAKGLIEWTLDESILNELSDLDAILDPENWSMMDHSDTVHTCRDDVNVHPWYSTRLNFAREFRDLKAKLNNTDAGPSWRGI